MKAGFKRIIDKVKTAYSYMLITKVSPKQFQPPNLVVQTEKRKVQGEEWLQQGSRLKCQASGLDVFSI